MSKAIPLIAVAAMAVVGQTPAIAETWRGEINPINQEQTGQVPGGTLTVTVEGGEVSFELDSTGFSPGMHLAHLHGFAISDPQEARCPAPDADGNGDGFIDLIETEESAGTTMIPLTENMESLEIASQTYPEADGEGRMSYSRTIDLASLEEAVRERFDSPLALENRVLFVHGVAEDAGLPETVRSLEGVPAHVTLPIACAELERVS